MLGPQTPSTGIWIITSGSVGYAWPSGPAVDRGQVKDLVWCRGGSVLPGSWGGLRIAAPELFLEDIRDSVNQMVTAIGIDAIHDSDANMMASSGPVEPLLK